MTIPCLSDDAIGIVTAFFDIGRGAWTPDKGLPDYLQRSTETYFERFAHLAALDNEMVVYTSPDLAPRIMDLRRGREKRTAVVLLSLAGQFAERRAAIARVQLGENFRNRITPAQRGNPEYWSPDYVLVTGLKAFFAAHAVQNALLSATQVAWIDFGYCRNVDALGGNHRWRYRFTPGKIHLFAFDAFWHQPAVADVTANNIICIDGAASVAPRDLWPVMAALTQRASDELMADGLVDDDQTLFYMATRYREDLFEIHRLAEGDWFPVIKDYNQAY